MVVLARLTFPVAEGKFGGAAVAFVAVEDVGVVEVVADVVPTLAVGIPTPPDVGTAVVAAFAHLGAVAACGACPTDPDVNCRGGRVVNLGGVQA